MADDYDLEEDYQPLNSNTLDMGDDEMKRVEDLIK